MEKYIWSPSSMGFFPAEERINFEALGLWPKDGVGISEEEHTALFPVPEGKIIDTVGGMPAWVNLPAPTHDELITVAEAKKQQLASAATIAIAPLQDAADLQIATEDEQALLLSWKKYRVLLMRVNSSTAPDITWPTLPESVTS